MFENKIVNGDYYSRYIASYYKIANKLGVRVYRDEFLTWLNAVGVPEKEAREIANLADNGKLELETFARQYLETLNKEKGSISKLDIIKLGRTRPNVAKLNTIDIK